MANIMHKLLERKEANPAEEFRHDPMMRELHEIRMKHYQDTKNLNIKEKIEKIKAEAKAFREGKLGNRTMTSETKSI